jgi:hypothetical protein
MALELMRPKQLATVAASSCLTYAVSQGLPVPPYEVLLAAKHFGQIVHSLGPSIYVVGLLVLLAGAAASAVGLAEVDPFRRDQRLALAEKLCVFAHCLLSGGPNFLLGCLTFREFNRDRPYAGIVIILFTGVYTLLPGIVDIFIPEPRMSAFESLLSAFRT